MAFTSADLSEDKKLVWAGLKRAQADQSAIVGELNKLKNNVGDYSTFKDDLNNYDGGITSYTEFDTYLTDSSKGDFTSSEADNFISKIKDSFTDEDSSGTSWDEFKDFALNQDTYTELKNGFGTQVGFTSGTSDDGESIAGIRILEGGGVTHAGVSTSVTTLEAFARRIEFSQAAAPRAEDGTVNFSNLRVTDGDDKASNVATVSSSMTLSVDIENTNSTVRTVSAILLFDDFIRRAKEVEVAGNTTVTVDFEVTEYDYTCYDAEVAEAGPLTVCWAPAGLT